MNAQTPEVDAGREEAISSRESIAVGADRALEGDVAKKGQRGGARPGAGRPPKDPSGRGDAISIWMPPSLVEALDAQCEAEGVSRTEFVVEVLRRSLARRKS